LVWAAITSEVIERGSPVGENALWELHLLRC
jgi:hypothetical protein